MLASMYVFYTFLFENIIIFKKEGDYVILVRRSDCVN